MEFYMRIQAAAEGAPYFDTIWKESRLLEAAVESNRKKVSKPINSFRFCSFVLDMLKSCIELLTMWQTFDRELHKLFILFIIFFKYYVNQECVAWFTTK